MTQDNPNGKKPPPPESLHFERSQVICQRCKRKFDNYFIEKIEDLTQLRSGDVLVSQAVLTCLHCGWILYWKTPEKNFVDMTDAYRQLAAKIGSYRPE